MSTFANFATFKSVEELFAYESDDDEEIIADREKRFKRLVKQEKKGTLPVIEVEFLKEQKKKWVENVFNVFLTQTTGSPVPFASMKIPMDDYGSRAQRLVMSLNASVKRPVIPSDPLHATVWSTAARPPWPDCVRSSEKAHMSINQWELIMNALFGTRCVAVIALHTKSYRVALVARWLLENDPRHGVAMILLDAKKQVVTSELEEGKVMTLSSLTEVQREKSETFQYLGTTLVANALFDFPKI
jgi:hypothetical protein